MQVLSPSNSCTKSHMQWSQSLLETSKSWEDKWGMSTPSLDLSLEVKYLCPSHCMLWLPNRLISYCSNSWGKNQFNQFLPFSPFLDLNLKTQILNPYCFGDACKCFSFVGSWINRYESKEEGWSRSTKQPSWFCQESWSSLSELGCSPQRAYQNITSCCFCSPTPVFQLKDLW
jgi:hypothetical protein